MTGTGDTGILKDGTGVHGAEMLLLRDFPSASGEWSELAVCERAGG